MTVVQSIKSFLSMVKFAIMTSFTNFQKIYMIGIFAIVLNAAILMIIDHFYKNVSIVLASMILAAYFLVFLISLVTGIYVYCKEMTNANDFENINLNSSTSHIINGSSLLMLFSVISTSCILSTLGILCSLIVLLIMIFY